MPAELLSGDGWLPPEREPGTSTGVSCQGDSTGSSWGSSAELCTQSIPATASQGACWVLKGPAELRVPREGREGKEHEDLLHLRCIFLCLQLIVKSGWHHSFQRGPRSPACSCHELFGHQVLSNAIHLLHGLKPLHNISLCSTFNSAFWCVNIEEWSPKKDCKEGQSWWVPLVVNKTKLQQAPGKPRSNFRAKNMKCNFHFSQLPSPSAHRGYRLLSCSCHVYVQCTINFVWAAELHKCKERGKPLSELVLCSYNWLTMVLKLQQLPAASSSTDYFQPAHTRLLAWDLNIVNISSSSEETRQTGKLRKVVVNFDQFCRCEENITQKKTTKRWINSRVIQRKAKGTFYHVEKFPAAPGKGFKSPKRKFSPQLFQTSQVVLLNAVLILPSPTTARI